MHYISFILTIIGFGLEVTAFLYHDRRPVRPVINFTVS